MKYIIKIVLAFFLFTALSFQYTHAKPPEETDRKSSRSEATAAFILNAEKYNSINVPENIISFQSPNGAWIQGLRCGTPHPTPKEADRIRREFNQLFSREVGRITGSRLRLLCIAAIIGEASRVRMAKVI